MIFGLIFIAIFAVPAIFGIIGTLILPTVGGVLLGWGIGIVISIILMWFTQGFTVYIAGILTVCFIATLVFWNDPWLQGMLLGLVI